MDVISVCKGLSLNDSYWISDENETKSFSQVNLYENRFSNILANIGISFILSFLKVNTSKLGIFEPCLDSFLFLFKASIICSLVG